MSSIKAIRNHIIFQFEREVVRKSDNGYTRNQFKDTTDWGFEINSYDESSKEPQWGIALSVGSEVEEVKVGDRILVEALQWTEGIDTDDGKVWRTDETKVMAIDESYQS